MFHPLRIFLTEMEFQGRRRKSSQPFKPLLLSMTQLEWQLWGTLLVCSIFWNWTCKISSMIDLLDFVSYRSRHCSSRWRISSSTYQRRRIVQNDRLWNASSLCYVSSIHPISTYIWFLFRLEIKRSQIMLTPISMSHTSITSQHHIFFIPWSNKSNYSFGCFVERISFPSFQVYMQPFFCYDLIDILIPSVIRTEFGLPSPIWWSAYHGQWPMGCLSR